MASATQIYQDVSNMNKDISALNVSLKTFNYLIQDVRSLNKIYLLNNYYLIQINIQEIEIPVSLINMVSLILILLDLIL